MVAGSDPFMPTEQTGTMIETAHWDDISLGIATPGEARALIRSGVENLTAETAQRIYEALRAWVWKALNQRRRDPELREWHDVIRSTRAVLSDTFPDLAARVATLADMIYESVMVAETFETSDIVDRPYVQTIVLLLRAGALSLEALAEEARMPVDRIKLIVNMMTYAGLVTWARRGHSPVLTLSSAGRLAAGPLIERLEAQMRQWRRPRKRQAIKPTPEQRPARATARFRKSPSHQGHGVRRPRVVRRTKPLWDSADA